MSKRRFPAKKYDWVSDDQDTDENKSPNTNIALSPD